MLNQLVYDFARWVDTSGASTLLHESYYMYNWVESTHVLALMISLGMLFLLQLRTLGLAFTDTPATRLATALRLPMALGFSIMFVTGALLFYAIPVRTSQSLWFRIKLVLLVAAAINAVLHHRQMQRAAPGWDLEPRAPRALCIRSALSLGSWTAIVICGRLIAYDWFDCRYDQSPLIATLAGCIDGQEQF